MMAGIVVPLRRTKAEEEEKFLATLEKMEDDERKQAEKDFYSKKDVEVQVWLKDFPVSAEDFKELRRSGAQHQPELEVSVHGLFLIEENFVKDVDDEDEIGLPTRPDSTIET